MGDKLKQSGIVRKIDDLGRIVLPKELRQTLNLSAGDDFEILIEGDNIVLKKFSRLTTLSESLQNLINIFTKHINFNIFITTNNKLINHNNEDILPDISKLIKERKTYLNEHANQIKISKTLIVDGKLIILPIIINSDLLGSIIAFGKEDIKNMNNILNILLSLIKTQFT